MSHSNDINQLYQLLKQATCVEFPPVLTSATTIFGIGTTGSKIVINLFRLLEASERGVPDGVIFIVADVDSDLHPVGLCGLGHVHGRHRNALADAACGLSGRHGAEWG